MSDDDSYYHVGFKLGSHDSLELQDSDGNTIDYIEWYEGVDSYPDDHDFVVWGRCPDGSASWGYTSTDSSGTPGAANPGEPYDESEVTTGNTPSPTAVATTAAPRAGPQGPWTRSPLAVVPMTYSDAESKSVS